MKLNEHELLAVLTALNSLTRADETNLTADVNNLYNKVGEAYDRVRRQRHHDHDMYQDT
mgnify:CR=1 FL=1